MDNLTQYSINKTANTKQICAAQRAENLYFLNSKNVLELCVGPSLYVLEKEYKKFGIQCSGNDIENKYSKNFPKGNWLIGDCFDVLEDNINKFDTFVFAPPLSKGCSGKREDSLSIFSVTPSYLTFLSLIKKTKKTFVLVLPGRSLSSKKDREEFYKLLSYLSNFEIRELTNGCRKYVDIYVYT